MSRDNDSDRKRKNPWGQNDGGKRRDNPWGGGSNGGGNGRKPNDIDDIIKNAQDGLQGILPPDLKGGFIFIIVALVVLVLWLASGFYIINPGEHGVIQRFGQHDRTKVVEGLGYHLPAPIETLTTVNVNQQRSMTIGYVEGVTDRRNGETLKRSMPEESLMLTSDRKIVDLHVAIQWDIKSAEDFLFEIQNQENTIKKVSESAIREVIGQTEMFPIITRGRAQISEQVQDIIQKNLDEYNSGVNIKQVLIQKAEVHPDVQQAFQDVQSANQDAENTKNIAEAYREKILPEARGLAIQLVQEAQGYKESKIAQAKGDADRFRSIYNAYLTGKDVTRERIYIETMEKVLSNAEKIIIDSGAAGGSGVVPYLPLNQLGTSSTRN